MKRMKRPQTIALALAIALLFVLAACGGGQETKTKTTDGAAAGGAAGTTGTASQSVSLPEVATAVLPMESGGSTGATEALTQNQSAANSSVEKAAQAAAPAQAADTRAYVEKVQSILNSKDFTLEAVTDGTPVTFAMSGEKLAVEIPTDWMLRQASANGMGELAGMDALFGKKVRLIYTPQRTLFVLPDMQAYLDGGAIGMDELSMDEFTDLQKYLGSKDALKGMVVSTAKLGDKQYQTATIRDDDGEAVARLYFLDGQLRRIEPLGDDAQQVVSALEITALKEKADAALFDTSKLLPWDLSSLAGMANLMDGRLPALPAGLR
ncbi:MAG: hypothetical protein LBC83_03185 [Oscillospiraceae bacterium]|jgi:hypothetical protein|nr:hypothetical protein [Oscillospiraceae bacterium]